MAKSLIIDPGHGGTDPGANGFGVREKDWNLRISLYQYERLKELGAKVSITRTNDKSLSSTARTNIIRSKYDYCISNHWNAFNGKARGVETIHSVYGGKELATNIANALVRASGLPLRRVFSRKNSSGGDYYFMHRLTGGTRTVIIEYGFIDNADDHNWYKNEANFYKAAEAVIEALCKELGITYKAKGNVSKPTVTDKVVTGKLFKVQAGAFKEIENAEKLHEKMEDKGINAFIIQENGLYKVQAGAYSVKGNAENQLQKVAKLVGEGFIVEEGTVKAVPKPQPKNKLVVDGRWGADTTKALQKHYKTIVDGIISGQPNNSNTRNMYGVRYGNSGSLLIRAMQKDLGTPQDGKISAPSLMIRALQKRLGTPVDGRVSKPSLMVKEMQRRLNNGTF